MARSSTVSAVAVAMAAAVLLAGCASGPRGGRDGAPSNPPSGLSRTPDAEPRVETIRGTNGTNGTSKPYTVLGRSYVPIADDRPFKETGLASWYGSKFHSQSTASGEPYDMYAMTAAHKTLPLPSYVRVRNPANGREAIVRVNDRGPFHDDRVIDLSYAAAAKLDLLRGVAPVEIERITNQEIQAGTWRSVDVPAVFTSPVVSSPRAEVAELPMMQPLAPLASSAPTGPIAQTADAPPGMSTAGFWVQLGAFSQRDGAIAFQQRMTTAMPQLAANLNVFSEGNTHRVQAGPYASRDIARSTAEQVRNGLQLAPIVVERR
ncbi:septal ring lytic transglycosylase RlpA family protein [Variovorax sp. PAMC28562]|uniref:septal ring lytic transglycosylase RlpA family protein n=1 Tax=Variovorax sp. PAMC28562 TaxID=2762323 RepID=UPI00164DCC12|nr:septal ring lytic transglycosylase RlpA family protein [Variovorax sp. PAMC28562]QNK74564.1 septal ring lytic transglycosylase RlpA family protein [Variovorax sp. PAMC28562]